MSAEAPGSTTEAAAGLEAAGTSAPIVTGVVPEAFEAEQRAVVEAHERALAAYRRAAEVSDPADAALPELFAGDFLVEVRLRLQVRSEEGQAVRDAVPSRARSKYLDARVSAPAASLTSCEVDDRVVYRVSDGSPVDAEVTTSRWSIAMAVEDGRWKVAGRRQLATWAGEEMGSCLTARS